MYSIRIRDHFMIAHSLDHPAFGPASRLHGATYVVDATFFSAVLNDMNVVLDISQAAELLKAILKDLNYKNLDDIEELKGKITTTEYLCQYLHEKLSKEVLSFFSGELRIELGESHIAWAAYQAMVLPI